MKLSKKQKLELAIKTAKERMKQLGELCRAKGCGLCQKFDCNQCPADDSFDPEPIYECFDYQDDIYAIISKLKDQIEAWEEELEEEAK